jgi:predicted CoA-binding protein
MRKAIESFLAERRIAVVGVSRTRGFGNAALEELRRQGWEAVPVNAEADELKGERCYRSLDDVPGPLGAVLCVVPPVRAFAVVQACVRRGVGKLWLQQGSESPEVIALAEAAGIQVVHHACVLMYAAPHGLHRFHGWLHHLGRPRPVVSARAP